MPELPEVEEVRRTLEPHILGKKIIAARILHPTFLTPPNAPLKNLAQQKFTQTLRHGKKLFCVLQDQQTLLFHLGMTGRIDAAPRSAPLQPHTHFILELQQQNDIRFIDPRRFGGVWYYPTLTAALKKEVTGRMGPDALVLEVQHLAHWKNAPGKLKARLLAQRDVAGLGNIYVDEALWLAKLHPLQRVARVPPASLALLVESIRAVLQRSLALGGTTLRDYRNVAAQSGAFATKLQAYGRAGLPCARCATPLKSILVAARTTVFCPICQRCR